MCLVMIVVMIESTGMFLALADMTDRPFDEATLTTGLRADGVGTIIGGIFNTFPYTSFSRMSAWSGSPASARAGSRVAGGIIMLLLGLLPKMAALVEVGAAWWCWAAPGS